MLEPTVIILRLLQYAGAMVLLGSSLFFVYALPSAGLASAVQTSWTKPLLASAGALLAGGALLSLPLHAILLAGSISEGLKPETLAAVITGIDLGKAAVIRGGAAALAMVLMLTLPPSRTSWMLTAGLGALATASFAWMGHGAATEGAVRYVHLASDIIHSWAAAIWLGALAGFLLLLLSRTRTAEATAALHRALQGFSGLGTALVAALVLTGAINSAILVGLETVDGLWTTAYGRLLSLKIVLFTAMLGLAAANRFRLTPALRRALDAPAAQASAVAALRRSVIIETGLGAGILGLVAWFGTLPPPSAH